MVSSVATGWRGLNDQHVSGAIKRACGVDCVHSWPWLMTSFISSAAVAKMLPAATRGGLQHACRVFSMTHDGGKGVSRPRTLVVNFY